MAGATRSRVRNEFVSVKIGEGSKEQVIGLKPTQFSLLAQASGDGAKVIKRSNDAEFGTLHRLGLVRFTFDQAGDWPILLAVLTPAGAQALAQEPLGHTRTIQ